MVGWGTALGVSAEEERKGKKKLQEECIEEDVLADAPRSGAPATFTPEQVCRIVALACEDPREGSGRPVSHWTSTQLADEAVERGIVESISARSVGRFWGEADLLKPHRMRYWLNNERAKEPEVFDAKVRAVCEHYAQALSLHEEGIYLVSTDEKSGIQALERLHPSLPMLPGLVERQEHEYVPTSAPDV